MPKTRNKRKRGKQSRRKIGGGRLGDISFRGIFGSSNNSNQLSHSNQQLNNAQMGQPQYQETNQLDIAQRGQSPVFPFPSTQQHSNQLDLAQKGMAPPPVLPPSPSANQTSTHSPIPLTTHAYPNHGNAMLDKAQMGMGPSTHRPTHPPQPPTLPSAHPPTHQPQPPTLPSAPSSISGLVGGSKKYKKRNKSRRKKNKRKIKRKTKRRR